MEFGAKVVAVVVVVVVGSSSKQRKYQLVVPKATWSLQKKKTACCFSDSHTHSPAYTSIQWQLISAVESHNVDAVSRLSFHTDSRRCCRLSGDLTDMSAQLVERALFVIENR
jgi:hypothetical protein